MKASTILGSATLAVAILLSPGIPPAPSPEPALADEDERAASSNEPSTREDGEPEVYIVTREFSVTRKGNGGKHGDRVKRHHGKARKSRAGRVAAETFKVSKNGTTVRLYPTLGVQDFGNNENVRGQVYSTTNARPRDVRSMRIGGALLQWNVCTGIYENAPPIPTEKTFRGVNEGASPWTNWYSGTNDCWVQTGHNYFDITLSNGNSWKDNVWGDAKIDL